MNNHKIATFIITVLSFVLIAAVHGAVYGQGKSNAPGQAKKESQTTQTSQKTNKGQEKKNEVVVGSVDKVTGNTIQMAEKKGNKQELTIDSETKVVGKDNKPVKLGAIKVKDIIALVGSPEGDAATKSGNIKVKKVFVQEASMSATMKRRAVQGVITNIAGSVLTVAHQIHRDRVYTVTVLDTTNISSKEASGSASLSLLAVGQRIVAVGDLDEQGGILAKQIHIIPGKATGIFERLPVSTPSASITPEISSTPSATPVITATVSATPTEGITATPSIPL